VFPSGVTCGSAPPAKDTWRALQRDRCSEIVRRLRAKAPRAKAPRAQGDEVRCGEKEKTEPTKEQMRNGRKGAIRKPLRPPTSLPLCMHRPVVTTPCDAGCQSTERSGLRPSRAFHFAHLDALRGGVFGLDAVDELQRLVHGRRRRGARGQDTKAAGAAEAALGAAAGPPARGVHLRAS